MPQAWREGDDEARAFGHAERAVPNIQIHNKPYGCKECIHRFMRHRRKQ
ncbi:hypothetical protein APY03_2021 [Variovorax sp. WDL1]|nr:hypothetical protein APY03_2021 [Variovorax sp. WDL1]